MVRVAHTSNLNQLFNLSASNWVNFHLKKLKVILLLPLVRQIDFALKAILRNGFLREGFYAQYFLDGLAYCQNGHPNLFSDLGLLLETIKGRRLDWTINQSRGHHWSFILECISCDVGNFKLAGWEQDCAQPIGHAFDSNYTEELFNVSQVIGLRRLLIFLFWLSVRLLLR
jgi:hypothetical protein